MSGEPVMVDPADAVRAVANRMADAELAAAIVGSDPPGILTARDVLQLVGAGDDPDAEKVGTHSTPEARTTTPSASLEEAAREMIEGDFRHLVVMDAGRTVGLLSMRDLVRCWLEARLTPHVVTPIREAMNTDVLILELDSSIRDAASEMSERGAAAAVVKPRDTPYPGIFTEREVLHSLRGGGDPASRAPRRPPRVRDDLLRSRLVAEAGRRGHDRGRVPAHRRRGPPRDQRCHLDA